MSAAGGGELRTRLVAHLGNIYADCDLAALADRLLAAMRLEPTPPTPAPHRNLWNESDITVITYGDTFTEPGEAPLQTLKHFLDEHLADSVSIVHILPFFPFSSDDGFAVEDYLAVNPRLGDWTDIERIAGDYRLMSDLVINHASGHCAWFTQLLDGRTPGKDYFYCADPRADLSGVVRPRTNPLLRQVETPLGTRHVWCTFSHDQPDLDFRNIDVLVEFARIIRAHLDHGVRVFRLDAIAFLWKVPGTSCLNLPQTHEVVRLLRTLMEHASPDTIIITETNIPNRENLTYFGNSNEAHMIYNFSLPPLLLHTLLTGNCGYLKRWTMSMPPAMNGTTYFNFIASHDGIGLRPVEGLLSDEEVSALIATAQRFGGHVSWRTLASGENRPYEINISLFDALRGTVNGDPDQWQIERFVCAHVIMLALEGVPAFYVHSLLATPNDAEKVKLTNNKRGINRHSWDMPTLRELLRSDTDNARVLETLTRLVAIRRRQPAFHPNTIQFTLQHGDAVFAIWRQNRSREQSIFAMHNVTGKAQEIRVADINLVLTDEWTDLIGGGRIEATDSVISLAPYQCVWLTNRPEGAAA